MTLAPPLTTQPGTPPAMEYILSLEPRAPGILLGHSRTPVTWGRMFGGEIAGQAVMAAHDGVPDDRVLHSVHGYFLLPGDPDEPVWHHVDRTRDGGSFTTRTVRSMQGDAVIFEMMASFQRPEESIEHAVPGPDVPGPDESLSMFDVLERADEPMSMWLRGFVASMSWEVRFPEPPTPPGVATDAPRRTWFRVRGDVPPEDRAMNAAALTHGSDLFLLGAAMSRHGISGAHPGYLVTSLDHAVWFHESPRVGEWLLYEARSAWAGGGRGLCRGRFWSTDGRLVATVAQEGLIRRKG